MKKTAIFLICQCASALLWSQVGLSNQVLGCFGAHESAGAEFEWSHTGGEAVINSLNSASYKLTQGFHQPRSAGGLFFELELGMTTCATSSDGYAMVIAVRGCEPPYEIVWSNGVTGARNERLTTGFQSVTVRAGDCELIREFEIVSDPNGACILRFFNAFSPNADGINDTWQIENVHLPEFRSNEVEIFNRWGQPVWSGRDYNNTSVVWDGKTQKGKELPVSTYFFVATFGGTVHKGYIELTR